MSFGWIAVTTPKHPAFSERHDCRMLTLFPTLKSINLGLSTISFPLASTNSARPSIQKVGFFVARSKYHLHLNPHAADAAVGVVAVQKTAGHRVDYIPLGHLHELWMIESIQGLPAKLQPPALADRKRLEQGQIEVIRPVGKERIPATGGRIGGSRAFHPMSR